MDTSLGSQTMDDELIKKDANNVQLSNNSLMKESQSSPYTPLAIAVIGIACKFAGADSAEGFWKILETGSSQYRDLPADRFPDWRFDRKKTPARFKANTLDDYDVFDHKFFRLSSREATFMDPQQRLAFQVSYQALESAGYFSCNALQRERDVGVYLGACTHEYHDNVKCYPPTAFSVTGSARAFMAGKISYHYGWTGPAIATDTACSSSGTAIHQACQAVANGDCNIAVAGGSNVFADPDSFVDLAGGDFLSLTGGSKAFDAAADGYCRGEGVAFVVLKKLSAALQDGDPIRGIIASTAIGQNAGQPGITVPHTPSQMALYRKALRQAELRPQDISYVEAHGTGTPVGDPIEVESIRGVFRTSSDHSQKTYLGSVKSVIGHAEAASGVSALIKVLLMMSKEMIPQQALFNKLNPNIPPLEPDGIEIAKCNTPWRTQFKAACVNNYGASGSNAVMIVTQPPKMVSSLDSASVTTYPISINAFSPSSLKSYCSALLNYIDTIGAEHSIADICYHMYRRMNLDLPCSVSATVSSLEQLKDLLKSDACAQPCVREKRKRPVILFFNGQTGKKPVISRAFYNSSALFRKHLDDCDMVLRALGLCSIYPAIFEADANDDVVLLHSMLFSGQYASAMTWLDCGLKVDRLVGYSFGQNTALCVSGVLSLRDALRFITGRARSITDYWGIDPGSMIAVEMNANELMNILNQHTEIKLDIACYNGSESLVVSGSTSSVKALELLLKSSENPPRHKRLLVSNANHSILTDPLIKPVRAIAEQLTFYNPTIPVETCSKGSTWQKATPDLIASHMRDPVYFHDAVERILEQLGPCVWLEAGSASGAPMLQRALGTRATSHYIQSLNLNSVSSLDMLSKVTSELWKSGSQVQFWPFHKMQKRYYKVINLPPYQFDRPRHWLDWKQKSTSAIEDENALPKELPLLELLQTTKYGAQFKVNTQCESWRKTCSEQRVLGVPICPVPSLVHLVFKAIDIIEHRAGESTGSYNVDNLVIKNPIPAEISIGLILNIAAHTSLQNWTFTFNSATSLSNEYASGTVFVGDSSSEEQFSRFQRLVNTTHVQKIANDDEVDAVRGKAVYKSLGDLFSVPDASRRVRAVSVKNNEAVGYLDGSFKDTSVAIKCFLHVPSVCLNSLKDRQDDQIFIIKAIGSVKVKSQFDFSSKDDASWAVYANLFGWEDTKTSCDVFVFDIRSKELVAVILNVTFSIAHVESLRQALHAPNPDMQTAANPQFQVPIVGTIRSTSDDSSNSSVSRATDFQASQEKGTEALSNKTISTKSTHLPDLTEALFQLLARVVDVDPDIICDEVPVAELGIDSLMAMEVTEEINKYFSVNVGSAEVATAFDVQSLCKLIADNTTEFYYDSNRGSRTPSDFEDFAPQVWTPISATSDTNSSSDGEVYDSDATKKSLETFLKAFDAIRDEFDLFAKRTGCDQFWSRVYPSQARLITAYITEAFAKLGCDIASMEAGTKISLPHIPRHDKMMVRLMQILSDDGLLSQAGSSWVRSTQPMAIGPPSSELLVQIVADFPQFAPEHQLLDVAASHLHDVLSGKLDPVTVLFGNAERRQMMSDVYLDAPLQTSAVQHLCSFLKGCFSSRTVPKPLRILEIGGGTCGTTMCTTDTFANLKIPVEYTFTDISAAFVSAAKLKLHKHKFIKYRTLDITEDPSPDLRGQYDVVIATNVIHATPDVCQSARNVRSMLRPGGIFTLIECTSKFYLADLTYGLLDGWWTFDDGRTHATMSPSEWQTRLHRAGFDTVDWTGGRSRESEIIRIILAC